MFIPVQRSTSVRGYNNKYQCDLISYTQLRSPRSCRHRHTLRGQFVLHSEHSTAYHLQCCYRSILEVCMTTQWAYRYIYIYIYILIWFGVILRYQPPNLSWRRRQHDAFRSLVFWFNVIFPTTLTFLGNI